MRTTWNDESDEVRLTHIGQAIAPTDETDAIERHLRRALKYVHTGHQGSFHVMIGETNTGKTTGQRDFMSKYAEEIGGRFEAVSGLTEHRSGVASAEFVSVMSDDGWLRPIVRIGVGEFPTFASLMADTVYCLTGRKAPAGNYFAGNMHLLGKQLYNQQIKLLIFDDVQHIAHRQTERSRYAAADVLKALAKVLNAEIVLAGLPAGTLSIVKANEQTVPLALNQVRIGAIEYPWTTDGRFVEFLEILAEMMPFDKPCPIAELGLAQRLHFYSDGVVGMVKSLLRAATVYALENGLDHVDMAVLAKTVETMIMASPKGNPFVGAPPPPPAAAAL